MLKVTPRRHKIDYCVEHWKPVFIKFKDHFNFEIIWCVKKKDFCATTLYKRIWAKFD